MEADSTSSPEIEIEERKEATLSKDEGTLSDHVDPCDLDHLVHLNKDATDDEKVREPLTENQEKDTEMQVESSESTNENVQKSEENTPNVATIVQDRKEPESIGSTLKGTPSTPTSSGEVASQCHEGARTIDDCGESESPRDMAKAVDGDQGNDLLPASSDKEETTSSKNISQNIDDGSETVSYKIDDLKDNSTFTDHKQPVRESLEVQEGQSEMESNKADQSACGSESVELEESQSRHSVEPTVIEPELQSKQNLQTTQRVSHSETLPHSSVLGENDKSEVVLPQMSFDDQEEKESSCEGNDEPMDASLRKNLEEEDKSDSKAHSDTTPKEDERLSETDMVTNADSSRHSCETELSKCIEDNPDDIEMNELNEQSKPELAEAEERVTLLTESAAENVDNEACIIGIDKQKETEESREEQVKEVEGEQIQIGKDEDQEGEDDEEEEEEEEEEDKDELSESKSEKRRSSPIRCFDESNFSVESLFEYQWPQDHGEYFFVQEQISEYLGVTSFKRKYPALERRLIALEERKFLKDKGVVTEEQVTLGLTALKADEVYDVMQKDFPDKYAAYARLIQERQREAVKNQHKEYGTPAVDSAKMKNYIKKAVRQAAEYNASLMREKREERQYYLDLQTMLIHCPKNKMKRLTKEQTKPGPYPVAVIPGQYQNYYKSYTTEELKYLPINTALYGPTATHKQSDIAPNIPPGSEISSDDEDLSVSSEPQKPSKSESSSKPTSKSSSKTPKTPSKGSSKSSEKQSKRILIEPPVEPERIITPGYFKDQIQSVLPNPPMESPMISLENSPAVTLAPPPPVSQVLNQLLQQKKIIPPKAIPYVPKDIPDAICGLCLKDKECNRKGEPEELVHCSQCDNSGHPSCLEMSLELVCAIKTYPWQCMECKTCTLCGDPTHEDKMMFCDECDRGYHTFCVGLSELPTGLWACASCRSVPPATPLPPPPETPSQPPPALNGTPESTTATADGDKYTNGNKRPAEPLPTEKESQETEKNVDTLGKEDAATPPPSKKRSTKKKTATPKPSLAS